MYVLDIIMSYEYTFVHLTSLKSKKKNVCDENIGFVGKLATYRTQWISS